MKKKFRQPTQVAQGWGTSLLDVISNALVSVLILFFVLSAMRSRPPFPLRLYGTLIIEYGIETKPLASLQYYAKCNCEGKGAYTYWNKDIQNISTPPEDSLQGIWDHAVVLSNGSEHFRRVYINNPVAGEWRFGIVYEQHHLYTREDFPRPASLWIKVYFKQGGVQKPILLETEKYLQHVELPTHNLIEVKVEMPKLETIS